MPFLCHSASQFEQQQQVKLVGYGAIVKQQQAEKSLWQASQRAASERSRLRWEESQGVPSLQVGAALGSGRTESPTCSCRVHCWPAFASCGRATGRPSAAGCWLLPCSSPTDTAVTADT